MLLTPPVPIQRAQAAEELGDAYPVCARLVSPPLGRRWVNGVWGAAGGEQDYCSLSSS